jgi:hypothetical protein
MVHLHISWSILLLVLLLMDRYLKGCGRCRGKRKGATSCWFICFFIIWVKHHYSFVQLNVTHTHQLLGWRSGRGVTTKTGRRQPPGLNAWEMLTLICQFTERSGRGLILSICLRWLKILEFISGTPKEIIPPIRPTMLTLWRNYMWHSKGDLGFLDTITMQACNLAIRWRQSSDSRHAYKTWTAT